MLKHIAAMSSSSPSVLPAVLSNSKITSLNFNTTVPPATSTIEGLKRNTLPFLTTPRCNARRRSVRSEDHDSEEEEYGHNEEIAMLEIYSQSARGEALLVHAIVDGQEVEVLIFKGFSSCLSYGTSPDPSRSVLPERAVIKGIDRIKGPFDPSNVEYLERGLTWEAFKSTRLAPKSRLRNFG